MTKGTTVIGVDESGKGDFFGPLVVCSFCCDPDQENELTALGVKDGKLLTDRRILELDSDLRKKYKYSLIVIGPEKYNQLYKKIGNLNKLLAWGHAQAIDNLTKEINAAYAVSDKFGKTELIENSLAAKGNEIELRQLVRGERIIQVAAASIIARAGFLKAIDALSAKHGITLPKGAAPAVDTAGRKLVAKHGVEVLSQVAKTHFKNYQRATKADLFA